ncbi:MAG TPA: VOC family protein [Dyella sp.]|uniref:VOC family protein n=1 Tax=Dyella sp. TaxID=1869338 RepID=UPI002B8528EF|nr:VOC family protein [Dyella sp.]HUB90151.1 VOC family protein [Dyella sp.]
MSLGRAWRVKYVSRNVTDLPRALAFYCDTLHFTLLEQTRRGQRATACRVARLQLGEQELRLVAFDSHGFPYPSRHSAADPWFQHLAIVVADMPAAYAQLCRHAFEPISQGGPQTLPPASGAVTAYKFRDPDGHPLELIHFPVGVGDPRWQHRAGLFLGIDQTALVAADLPQSLAFYQQLGFRVMSRSRQRGPEQQRLDGITDVDVEVVALAAALDEPPRLELLCYRAHADEGMAMAPDDVAADRTVMEVEGGRNVLVKDPTGHRLVLRRR